MTRSRPIPPEGWFLEAEIENGPRRRPDVLTDVRWQPTVNTLPRLRAPVRFDETWTDAIWDNASLRVWNDLKRLPVDVLDHREIDPTQRRTMLEGRGGSQLEQRVVARTEGVVEVAEFVTDLIETHTDYEAVIDAVDAPIRAGETLLSAATQAALQTAAGDIPETLPVEFDGDTLTTTEVGFTFFDFQNRTDDDFVDGTADIVFSPDTGGISEQTFEIDHEVPAGDGVVAIRSRSDGDGSQSSVDVRFDGEVVPLGDDTFLGDGLSWSEFTLDEPVAPGSHSISVDPGTVEADDAQEIDCVAFYDARFTETEEFESVHEPEGHLERPRRYPERDSPALVDLAELAAPLAVASVALDVTAADGDTLPALALREDGTGEFVEVTETTTQTLSYDDLSATVEGRIGLGHAADLDPQDATPRIGYEPQAVETVEIEADLDETPVLIDRTFDDRLVDILREAMDVFDGVFEIQAGDDAGDADTPETEIHVARIDGRESTADPSLIDWSFDRQTEDAVDRAVVYGSATTIRRLPFEAEQGEWETLPLGDGRIVEGSAVIDDAATDDEPLERGSDYRLREVVDDGPPEIRLDVDVDEPRLDCEFKPRAVETRDRDDAFEESDSGDIGSGDSPANIFERESPVLATADVSIDSLFDSTTEVEFLADGTVLRRASVADGGEDTIDYTGPLDTIRITNVDDSLTQWSYTVSAAQSGATERDVVRDAPALRNRQMAALAAFQAVEGAYTQRIIEAEVVIPAGGDVISAIDALNVADLPGDVPYQVRDVDIDAEQTTIRLGAGSTAGERIDEINRRARRVSERV